MSGRILVGDHDGVYVIRFVGDVRVTLSGAFDHYLEAMLHDPQFSSVLVDLDDAVAIDSTSLGGLAKLSISVQERHGKLPTLMCHSADILRVLSNMGFDDIFAIVDGAFSEGPHLAELPIPHDMSQSDMREKVIEAHKVLMSLNDTNQAAFKDLVRALEQETKDGAKPAHGG
ncbi:MAG: STAS domain-containing protein [Pseudomonadales bacterium]